MFLNYLKNFYKLSTSARGRVAGRAEYFVGLTWGFVGYFILSGVVAPLLFSGFAEDTLFLGVRALAAVFFFYPTIALSVRRLHDFGLTGWLYIIPFVFLFISVYVYFALVVLIGLLPTKVEGNKFISMEDSQAPQLQDNLLIGFRPKRVLKFFGLLFLAIVLLIIILSVLGM